MECNYVRKYLSESDVASKLTLLIEWVGDGKLFPAPAPGSVVPIPTKDDLGNDHTFMLKARPLPKADVVGGERRSYHMKPEFQRREWHAYVVEKGLTAGDAIYFWWDSRGFFRVQARQPPRTYRLFGTNFLY